MRKKVARPAGPGRGKRDGYAGVAAALRLPPRALDVGGTTGNGVLRGRPGPRFTTGAAAAAAGGVAGTDGSATVTGSGEGSAAAGPYPYSPGAGPAAVALHFAHYNFVRVHSTLRVTPAMAAGISGRLWSMRELVEAAEQHETERLAVLRRLRLDPREVAGAFA